MQRPRRRPDRPHRQLDLNLATCPPTPVVPPAWGGLAGPTQQLLTGLLSRLLVAHAAGVVPELTHRLGDDTDER